MTDETEHTDDDLAAEYVLGVLDADTRAQVAHRVAIDHGFARLVDGWEQRLSGMNEAYLEIDPPSRVKEALTKQLFPDRRRWLSPRWAAVLGITLATAVSVAVILMVPSQITKPDYVAVLESAQSDFSFQAEIRGRELAVFTTGAGAPEGRALEVWLIEGDADPVSLGLIGGALSLGDLTFNTGTVLAVSIEPPGGSPSGTPTGQVVALGDLRNVLG